VTDQLDEAVGRYFTGRPLAAQGSGGYPFLGWRVLAARWLAPAAGALLAVGWVTHPAATRGVVLLAVAVGLVLGRRWWLRGRFRRAYISPTVTAIRVPVGTADVQLHVDPGLGRLVARLAKPLSPAEAWLRERYGRFVEPGWRWPADQLTRARWALWRRVGPTLVVVAVWFRRPREEQHGPRIALEVAAPFVTAEQRSMISAIVRAKIPVSDLIESWDQVGSSVSATWVPRQRPPASVGLDELLAHGEQLPDHEIYLGQGPGNRPVVISLHEDSPHIAVSAGSGAGKSVLAQLVAVQVLRRGGQVVILDRKGSHRWALGMPGVDYCTKPPQMSEALLRVAGIADQRNSDALHEADDWCPGPRILVIAEELNATLGMIAAWWAQVRQKHEPKKPPAITALAEIAFMGRSALCHLLAVAQMLTARAIGGPEARENFGIRALARYTTNAAKMLVPEASLPRASRTLGRWQIVVAGTATETQVCYLTRAQARAYARVADARDGLDGPLSSDVACDTGAAATLTLRQACEQGVIPWRLAGARKRLERDPRAPKPVGTEGQAHLYRRGELVEWGSR
jgi:hypothetical protein